MDVKVASRLGHAVARAVSPSALVGNGMLIRLRSTTIGILGLVAAVGLGLVGIVSQQGWPGVLGGPLPQAPSRLVENDPISAPPPAFRRLAPVGHRAARPSRTARQGGPAAPVNASVSPGDPIGTSPPPTPGSGDGQPQAQAPPTVVAQAPRSEEHPTKGSSTSESSETTTSSSSHTHSDQAHGRPDGAPGHWGDAPGHSDGAPGHSGQAPGHSGRAPGHSGDSHRGHH